MATEFWCYPENENDPQVRDKGMTEGGGEVWNAIVRQMMQRSQNLSMVGASQMLN